MQNIVTTTDAYFNMLLHYAIDNPFNILAAFFLMLARILPIMMMAPFLGAKNAPNSAKMLFSLALCAILLPQVLIPLKEPLALDGKLIGYTIKELFVGFVLGFLVTIPFYVAQSSGSLIDHIRGSQSLQVSDPTTQTQTGPVGIFYNYVLLVVFFAIGGPFYFFEGLSHSFEVIPVNGYLNPYFFSLTIPFWKSILALLTHITSLSIQLGAPSIIGILMAEMFLGIANRMAPQVQIVFLGISLKSFVGLALLAAAWFFIINQFEKESMIWLKSLSQTIRYLAPLH